MNAPDPTPAEVATLACRTYAHVAVGVPCYNEGVTVASVVDGFRASLPGARIVVFDNNSTDDTADVARSRGAEVHTVRAQGKGRVVQQMFADLDEPVVVMVDGDGTYDATAAPRLVELLTSQRLDMVIGERVHTSTLAYRRGHVVGNRVFRATIEGLFGEAPGDMLSGYRAFSRRFVKSFPLDATGFEVETAMTVHALQLRAPVASIETPYVERPEGSTSKLHTYRDGWRIIRTILRLVYTERPLVVCTAMSLLLTITSLILAAPVIDTYVETGLVPRLPTAVLSGLLMLLAILLLTVGMVLNSLRLARREMRRLAYLAVPASA